MKTATDDRTPKNPLLVLARVIGSEGVCVPRYLVGN